MTDDSGTVNIGFSLIDEKCDESLVVTFTNSLKESYKKKFPDAKWVNDGVLKVDNKKIGYLKFITNGIDQKIFNYIFITDVDNKIMIGTFNCLEKDMTTWSDVSDKIVSSLRVK